MIKLPADLPGGLPALLPAAPETLPGRLAGRVPGRPVPLGKELPGAPPSTPLGALFVSRPPSPND